jgi:eukaryotic-like serine/threonine-protein kinase
MALSSGAQLGPYKVQSLIGSGGMGEVYRARDTRLDRSVAVKVLRPHLSRDRESRLRFEREARAVSSLSHPNICPLFDIGRHGDVDFLVMQFLDGENLAYRLTRGALPLELALKHAIDIACALEAAHRNGVLHRDLKPGNIMLTKSGAKLMDFGLAKLVPSSVEPLESRGTTKTAARNFPVTSSGMIVGTLQYMAPEVIEGAAADERSDVFSFGAVLYEMLTGKAAFQGKTQASVIAAVLTTQPEPLRTLQPVTPPELERIVAACLAKDPSERFSSIHDVRIQLEWVRDESAAAADSQPKLGNSKFGHRKLLLFGLLFAIALLAAFLLYQYPPAYNQNASFHTTILPPDNGAFVSQNASDSAVVSPDGRDVVFLASVGNVTQLWLRSLDSFTTKPIPGTEGADEPFWSPDSRSIGFFADGKLKRVRVSGGPPFAICKVDEPRGGSWNKEDVIIFGEYPGEIFRVSASGGTPQRVSEFDVARRDTTHRWPVFLPDGKNFIYLASDFGSANQDNMLYVGSIDGGPQKPLIHGTSNIRFANGYLLYLVERTLMAQPFDPKKLAFTGEPQSIAENVYFDYVRSNAVFSASTTGVLIYRSGNSSQEKVLRLFSRQQNKVSDLGKPAEYIDPRFSPDGQRVAYHVLEPTTGRTDIWVEEIKSGNRRRLTLDPTRSRTPVWSPDGSRLAYYSLRSGKSALYVKNVDGIGNEVEIREPDDVSAGVPTDWTGDGRKLIVEEKPHNGKSWLSIVPLDPPNRATPLIQVEGFNVGSGHISSNSWLAYESDESGRYEVYVSPYPTLAGRVQISTEGGRAPRWARGGKELLYLAPDHRLMIAELSYSKNSAKILSLKPLLPQSVVVHWNSYDVSADGNWVVFEEEPSLAVSSPLNVIINWTSDLRPRP